MIQPTPKQARALELRRQGKTWTEIGALMGTTAGTVYKLAMFAQIKEYRLQQKERTE